MMARCATAKAILFGVAAAALVAFGTGGAIAQSGAAAPGYPKAPIKIIVPFPPGGGTDLLARIVGDRMNADWGQPVIVENRPGANTIIGAELAARAAPDGYTLLAAMDVTMVMNPVSGMTLPYDPLKDFSPITLLAKNGNLLSVRAADGPQTLQELIAKGKAEPGKLTFGGGVPVARLAGFLVAKEAGFDAVMVPYKGSAEALQGLLTHSVDFVVDGIATTLPFVTSGQFRALAKLDQRPITALPNVPTIQTAANLPHFDDITAWTALVAPAGTPTAIIDKIQREVAQIYADPKIAKRLVDLGISGATSTPQELGDFNRREIDRWSAVVKKYNVTF
jgi:tripartite-type tricarboxylate transporter receptor subunit TctC